MNFQNSSVRIMIFLMRAKKKNLNKYFLEKYLWMANKHMKIPTSLVFRKMQLATMIKI
jgi:putative ribosome biogenesis GTPase RsgA